MTTADGTPSTDQRRAAARDAYRASLAEGLPLTGAELGRQFGLSPRWGRDRVAEVYAEAIATGNGSRPTEHHARESPGLDHRRASLTLRPEGRPTDDADSGADSALGESNGSAPPSARRAASVPPSIDGAPSAVTPAVRSITTMAVLAVANVAAADPTAVGRMVAAWPPVALLLAWELLMQVRAPTTTARDVTMTHAGR